MVGTLAMEMSRAKAVRAENLTLTDRPSPRLMAKVKVEALDHAERKFARQKH